MIEKTTVEELKKTVEEYYEIGAWYSLAGLARKLVAEIGRLRDAQKKTLKEFFDEACRDRDKFELSDWLETLESLAKQREERQTAKGGSSS